MSEIEMKARAWDALMDYLMRNGKTMSLREARRVVGGEVHLDTLIADGKINEIDNGATASNCKRLFPAAEVYAHIRVYK